MIAEGEKSKCAPAQRSSSLRAALAKVVADKKTAANNMALAQSPQQFEAMAAIFNDYASRESQLQLELKDATATAAASADIDSEVTAALGLLERLTDLAANGDSIAAAGELFRLANARLYLRFVPVKLKRRVVHRVAGGVVTFGATRPPIEIYSGKTSNQSIKSTGKNTMATVAVSPDNSNDARPGTVSVGNEKSIGNVSRGDRI